MRCAGNWQRLHFLTLCLTRLDVHLLLLVWLRDLSGVGAFISHRSHVRRFLVAQPGTQNQMVLVRRRSASGFGTKRKRFFADIIRPFAGDTWGLLLCVVAIYVLILIVLSMRSSAPVFGRLPLWLCLLRVLSNLCVLAGGTLSSRCMP